MTKGLKRKGVTTMPNELKPCPFCGGEATIRQNDLNYYYVCCKKCPAEVGRYWYKRKQDAKNAWNRRSDNG